MEEKPLVSIIVPCYNHEKFLCDFAKSIMEQDYNNIEVLILDDCSTDKSWEKLQELGIEMSGHGISSKLMRNEKNLGITKTLNHLIQVSHGKLIKVIASDDMFASTDSISQFVSFFRENDYIDVAVCNGKMIQEQDRYPVVNAGKEIYGNPPKFSGQDLFINLYCNNFIFAPGVMIKRSVYDKFGTYSEGLMTEDWEFWLRITRDHGVNIGYIEKALIYYRKSSNSMTSLTKNRDLEARRIKLHSTEMEIIEQYKEYVPKRIYASKKIKSILKEQQMAKKCQLENLFQITEKEYDNFNMWKYLSVWDKLYIKMFKAVVKFI